MEEKINIAEILKDKPKGLNLYSPVYGKVKFEAVHKDKIYFYHDMNEHSVKSNGKSFDDGEVVIFPSQKMRDWSKFAWKKGDILVNKDARVHIIFDGFEDDTYKNFHGQYYLWEEGGSIVSFEEDENYMQTSDFNKANKEDAQEYIHKIEKELGGKLNMETLEIEKQSEFKDGDVLFVKCMSDDFIEIFNYSKKNGDLYDHVSLAPRTQELDISGKYKIRKDEIVEIRLATEEEKKQLFSVLAKKGKTWDSEKKAIVGLKPKFDELKPFDRVLVRDSALDKWRANLFGYIDKDEYYHCVYANWAYCIPYIGNESLLGTTKDVEG